MVSRTYGKALKALKSELIRKIFHVTKSPDWKLFRKLCLMMTNDKFVIGGRID